MHDLDDRLTEALLLDLLDMPISFHRCFIAITGRLTAALLLSHLWWVSEEASAAEHEGWIVRSIEAIREETGLSRDELAGARRVLRDHGILTERRQGIPPTVAFRVNQARVAQLLIENARRRALDATPLAAAEPIRP
jgi:DNA-binding transcriptional ArsR family regulator